MCVGGERLESPIAGREGRDHKIARVSETDSVRVCGRFRRMHGVVSGILEPVLINDPAGDAARREGKARRWNFVRGRCMIAGVVAGVLNFYELAGVFRMHRACFRKRPWKVLLIAEGGVEEQGSAIRM